MYAVYKSLFPRTRHFVWQSTPVQVSDLTTGWTGSVRVAVLDIHGSASWRSTSGLLQLPPGIWPVIVKSAGRNDPSPVKRSSEWVSVLYRDCHAPPFFSSFWIRPWCCIVTDVCFSRRSTDVGLGCKKSFNATTMHDPARTLYVYVLWICLNDYHCTTSLHSVHRRAAVSSTNWH